MAGGAVQAQMEAHLTTNEVLVFQDRADGLSWKKVAAKWGCSTFVLNCWLKGDTQRHAAWKALDDIAAEARASDAGEILEEEHLRAHMGFSNPESARLAVARAELAKWEAGIMARGRFGGEKGGAGVIVNVQHLHLTAVRELALHPPPPPPGLLPPTDAEFIVLPSDDASLEDLLNG